MVDLNNFTNSHKVSVAPMMDWTDRHCRYFHRLLSPNAYLYTEMVTTNALIHGDKDRFLRFDASEHPIALQLGGNDPKDMALCAEMAQNYNYDSVDINCGCPSDRVQSGAFGACLMNEPETVAACVKEMGKAVDIPVTLKCRIGIDDSEDFDFLDRFISINAEAGCEIFIIHARKAWLKGLSPKENREIPPLKYDIVQQIKEKYPELHISLNGGIKDVQAVSEHIKTFDGVMIGREAYQNPLFLHALEKLLYPDTAAIDINDVLTKMANYADEQRKQYGTPLKSISRHMIGLFSGTRGAKHWRRQIAERAHADDAKGQLLLDIYDEIKAKNR